MHAPADPLELFADWYREAVATEPRVPDAMTLATVDAEGRPSSRVVLVKGFDPRGFVFYTNLGSRKAREIAGNPHVALDFNWKVSMRQVRIRGRAQPVADAEADAYFATRARGSQLGAWASRQSEELVSPEVLRERLAGITARFEGSDVPRPPFWSGYRVVPDAIEFWQNADDRLHDRLEYRRAGDGWETVTLYP